MRRVAIAVLLAGLAAADPHCRNPVVDHPHDWGERRVAPYSMHDLNLDEESHPHPEDASACKALEDEESCCSEDTLKAIDKFGDRAEERIERAEEVMEAVVEHISESLEHLAEHCSPTWCSDDVKEVIEEYQEKLKEAIEDLTEARVDCLKGLAAYAQGMLCFACIADYEQYLDEDGHVIHLAHVRRAHRPRPESQTDHESYPRPDPPRRCRPPATESTGRASLPLRPPSRWCARWSSSSTSSSRPWATWMPRARVRPLSQRACPIPLTARDPHRPRPTPVPSRMFQLQDMCNGTDCKHHFCHHHVRACHPSPPLMGGACTPLPSVSPRTPDGTS